MSRDAEPREGGRQLLRGTLGRIPREAAGIVVVVAVALFAGVVPEFQALQLTQWILYGLLALSLTFVWGYAGIFSFGQAAFFGIGGYAYGVAAINLVGRTGETFSAVLVAVAAAALTAAILGYFMFYGKVGDVYVAIITLAFTLVLFTFMSSTAGPQYTIGEAPLGGYNGMIGIPPLSYGWPGGSATPLNVTQMLALVASGAVILALGLRVLLRRPFGRIVAGLRENELRTQLLGYDVRRYKLIVFVIGGAIAGLAGSGYAMWGLIMTPTIFSLQQAALVVIFVLVGGRTSLLGAFVGAILLQGLSSVLGGSGGNASPIILGLILIAIVMVLPQGLVPAAGAFAQRFVPRLQPERPQLPVLAASPERFPVGSGEESAEGEVLEAVDLRKAFGGLAAVDGVSLAFAQKGVHCLIGPNGAGKSTFFNLLVGRYRPTSGRVMFSGEEITRREPHERVRRGLGIKLQVASLYKELPVFENMWLASYAKTGDADAANTRTSDILGWLDLTPRANDLVGALAHGQQQWLEIGMALATEPATILLDEPTAGMTREETTRTAELVTLLGERASVIVVEHDMEFVRQLDVPVTVFHQGKIFTQGSIDELRRDERVLEIYLGRGGNVEA
ncbi:MAG: ATP-binding cassette domain-containing protein [Actinomycetota bacterium]|nr:ATP-binding cassette domain-containing protein [Actinomycetota bacterium]